MHAWGPVPIQVIVTGAVADLSWVFTPVFHAFTLIERGTAFEFDSFLFTRNQYTVGGIHKREIKFISI